MSGLSTDRQIDKENWFELRLPPKRIFLSKTQNLYFVRQVNENNYDLKKIILLNLLLFIFRILSFCNSICVCERIKMSRAYAHPPIHSESILKV